MRFVALKLLELTPFLSPNLSIYSYIFTLILNGFGVLCDLSRFSVLCGFIKTSMQQCINLCLISPSLQSLMFSSLLPWEGSHINAIYIYYASWLKSLIWLNMSSEKLWLLSLYNHVLSIPISTNSLSSTMFLVPALIVLTRVWLHIIHSFIAKFINNSLHSSRGLWMYYMYNYWCMLGLLGNIL